jgi:Lrp/AsnC family transcriptional regulator for asnA, asnC and gidA
MLDELDRRIIFVLRQDGRQGMEVLASQVGASIPTTRKRMQALIESGVIHIQAGVDPEKVGGPLSVIVALRLEGSQLEAAINQLGKYPSVLAVLRIIGHYDLLTNAWFRSVKTMATFLENMVSEIQGIKETETFILLNHAKGRFTTLNPSLIDSEDDKLISLLQMDGRRKKADLAAELKLSPATIGRRIQHLLDTETIRIAAFPDPKKSDFQVNASLTIRTKPGQILSVVDKLVNHPEIRWLSTCTGRFDVFAMAMFPNHQNLIDYVSQKIKILDGVEQSELSMIGTTHYFYNQRHNEFWMESNKQNKA